MASDKDIVGEARAILNAANAYTLRIQVRELLGALADEVEALRRGEFICKRCHHRKDAEGEEGV